MSCVRKLGRSPCIAMAAAATPRQDPRYKHQRPAAAGDTLIRAIAADTMWASAEHRCDCGPMSLRCRPECSSSLKRVAGRGDAAQLIEYIPSGGSGVAHPHSMFTEVIVFHIKVPCSASVLKHLGIKYTTTAEEGGVLQWLHQVNFNCPEDKSAAILRLEKSWWAALEAGAPIPRSVHANATPVLVIGRREKAYRLFRHPQESALAAILRDPEDDREIDPASGKLIAKPVKSSKKPASRAVTAAVPKLKVPDPPRRNMFVHGKYFRGTAEMALSRHRMELISVRIECVAVGVLVLR